MSMGGWRGYRCVGGRAIVHWWKNGIPALIRAVRSGIDSERVHIIIARRQKVGPALFVSIPLLLWSRPSVFSGSKEGAHVPSLAWTKTLAWASDLWPSPGSILMVISLEGNCDPNRQTRFNVYAALYCRCYDSA